MTRQKNGIWKLTDSEMNYFAILASEAKERYAQLGLNALQGKAKATNLTIYHTLLEAGFYDDKE